MEIGSLRYEDNVPIAPGTVVEARIDRVVVKGQLIEVETDAGIAIINPATGINNGEIPKMSGAFTI